MGEKNNAKTGNLLDSAPHGPHRSVDSGQFLTNSNIAELLAAQSETAPLALQKAPTSCLAPSFPLARTSSALD
jgi:hypothetical protein